MQMKAMVALYEHEQAAVFDRTGEGKSHIVRLLGTLLVLCGVYPIFHPSPSLTADQLTAFQSDYDDCGSIIAINLDEIAMTIAI